ncbi:MAG TPA: OmpA family protein [Saprospiraceae bacterium]|nr:OmpA family protein [Saprospiraceae bacterium]
MSNLLDSLKNYITPELISRVASSLDENEVNTGKAISGLAPTILAGLLGKTGDSGAMGQIFNLVSKVKPDILNDLGSLIGGGNLSHNDPKDASGHLLGMLFGPKVPAINQAISSFSGVKSSSTSSLMGLVGPLVMGLLNKRIGNEGLNLSGFTNLLLGERSNILGALPAGLGSILGLAGSPASAPVQEDRAPATGTNWLWPLLLLLGLGAALIYFMRSCSSQPAEQKTEMTAPVAPPPAPAPAPAPEKFTMKLPTGYEVVGSPMGIEAMLLKFIQNPDSVASKTNWFDFDHLLFKTGSDQLEMEQSRTQLTNVYEILKAYPKVKIKIGGYTDNVGDAKQNKSLSDRRAKTVMSELLKMGIEKGRMEAEGYGQEHPVATNDTEEGRARNRRVSVSVRAK